MLNKLWCWLWGCDQGERCFQKRIWLKTTKEHYWGNTIEDDYEDIYAWKEYKRCPRCGANLKLLTQEKG